MLSYLIDNALKWARSTVAIVSHGSWIEISDDGPGIPVEQRTIATTVGMRLDPATPGTGPGLAATADLLRFYDAS